jgi:hypothetical protein
MTVRIFVLLGGLYGPDGEADSHGMVDLAERLKPYGKVTTHFWSNFESVAAAIKQLPADVSSILIGYSGGGSRATWVAGAVYPRPIKLLVAYDPSPWWQMTPLRDNVQRALCYHNNAPLMFGLGGGQLTGAAHIENTEISEQHLAVDYDQNLHARTIDAVREVSA